MKHLSSFCTTDAGADGRADCPARDGCRACSPQNDFFQTTTVVPVHLEFTEADYKALAPHGSNGMFGFGGGSAQSWLQGAEGKRNGFAASRGVEFDYVHAGVTIGNLTLKNIGVRYKGNGTHTSTAIRRARCR